MKNLKLLNLNCREAARLVSEGMDRRLSFVERLGLRLHLLICSACRQWRRQVFLIRKVLRMTAAGEAEGAQPAEARLTETARERIREAIESVC